MQHTLLVSDEDLAELESLLRSELKDAHSELRRTRNPQFREQIRHRMELAEHLLGVISRSSTR